MDAPDRKPDRPGPDIAGYLREALEALGRAETAAPLEIQLDASQAEKSVVQARNALIDRLREGPSASRDQRLGSLLDRVNEVLSIIVGIEYPSSYVRREMIGQARDQLKELLAAQEAVEPGSPEKSSD